jgi:hypothetical protein
MLTNESNWDFFVFSFITVVDALEQCDYMTLQRIYNTYYFFDGGEMNNSKKWASTPMWIHLETFCSQ